MERNDFFDKWGLRIKDSAHGDAAAIQLLRHFIDDLDSLVDHYLKEGSKTAHIEVAPRRTR